MDLEYTGRLKCATCGHDSYFEPNHDESYIMCMFCHREYIGGYKELFELNSQKIGYKNTKVATKENEAVRQSLSESLEMK